MQNITMKMESKASASDYNVKKIAVSLCNISPYHPTRSETEDVTYLLHFTFIIIFFLIGTSRFPGQHINNEIQIPHFRRTCGGQCLFSKLNTQRSWPLLFLFFVFCGGNTSETGLEQIA